MRGGARGGAGTALCLLLALGACAGPGTPAPELLGIEGRDRETLAAVYPPGTLREVVRARQVAPLTFSIHPCDFGTVDQDPALSAALDAFRTEFPRITPSCDRVRLARPGWVSLFAGFAYYQDYVFYDGEDQVLIAYRTFLQRSPD